MKKGDLSAREPEPSLENPSIIGWKSCHHEAPLITHEPRYTPPPHCRHHLVAWLTTQDKTAINDTLDIRSVRGSQGTAASVLMDTASAASSLCFRCPRPVWTQTIYLGLLIRSSTTPPLSFPFTSILCCFWLFFHTSGTSLMIFIRNLQARHVYSAKILGMVENIAEKCVCAR